ncbi:MAG: translation initiation factor IF-2 [Nanoarchaeota archaeon]
MTKEQRIRQPIVTVCGHVDHGKTSILDQFRGTDVQAGEAGGITQRISFTKYPIEQIIKTCPLIAQSGVRLDIPGFLFIDTPGHAAFTNLRKRGGSLADLAILVVNIKEGIMPQTAEVLQILKANKTPFVVALNKVDNISGWRKQGDNIKKSLELQPIHVRQEFDLCFMQFQASLQEHGFESDLYFEVTDFTKKIALVPCSAKTGEGINDLLFVLCGLCQRFLKERLKVGEEAKGVILEVKKDKTQQWAEAILYDGKLDEGDELVVASFGEPVMTKIRSMGEIVPLANKYKPAKSVVAASGVRIQLTESEHILPGMPFQEVKKGGVDLEEIKKAMRKEISGALKMDKQGIIIKADSLGSLEALITLLKQERVQILKAGIGPISKTDVISACANLEIDPLDALIIGFNVGVDEEVEVPSEVKVLKNEVVYKLIEDLGKWRKEKSDSILKEKLMGLATICKLEILPQYVFRNSNPAVFGVKVFAGKVKLNIPLIDENGEQVGHIKSLQEDKIPVGEALEGRELAMSLPGITFDRQLKGIKYLYSDINEQQFKQFKKNKDILMESELRVLNELMNIKRRKNENWGI